MTLPSMNQTPSDPHSNPPPFPSVAAGPASGDDPVDREPIAGLTGLVRRSCVIRDASFISFVMVRQDT